MKLLVLNVSLQPVGGTEVYVRTQLEVLVRRGHHVHACSEDPSRPDGLPDAVTWAHAAVFSPSLRPHALKDTVRSARALVRSDWDAALLHSVEAPLAVELLQRAMPTLRFVHTAWSYCPAGTRWLPRSNQVCDKVPGLGCLAVDAQEACMTTMAGAPFRHADRARRLVDLQLGARLLNQATRLVANSHYTARELRILTGRPEIDVLTPPVSPSTAPTREPIPGRLLIAGRLVPVKGHRDALEVVRRLPGARLVVLGDGPERAALEQIARDAGTQDRVEFRGWVPGEVVDAEMQAASVVLFTSRWPETYGLAGAQAAVAGRPVVAYALGGVTDWLRPDTGAGVRPGDVDGLTAAVAALLADPAAAKQMGARAQEGAAHWFQGPYGERLDALLALATQAAS